jgi:hypothetical protein
MSSVENKNSPLFIDIYQHLKLNFQNKPKTSNCGHNPMLYCIPCKINFCEKCEKIFHKDHLYVSKKKSELNKNNVNFYFKEIEDLIEKENNKINEGKNQILNNYENFYKTLNDIILKNKKENISNIKNVFLQYENYIKESIEKINEIKNILINYNNKYKNFLKYNEENNDETNTMFLLNYDIINNIKNSFFSFKNIFYNLNLDVNNYIMIQNLSQNDFINNLTSLKDINNEKEKYYEPFLKENKFNLNDKIKKDLVYLNNIYIPEKHFKFEMENLNKTNYNEINEKIKKYSEEYEKFKKIIFDKSINNKKFLNNIKKDIDSFEIKYTNNDDESLFPKKNSKTQTNTRQISPNRTLNNQEINNLDTNNNNNTNTINNIKNTPSFNNLEDITLDNKIIKKYFNLIMLSLYKKNFKKETVELQSSHEDLKIKHNADDNNEDYAKIIENTNTILIFYKKTNKLIKRKINLQINPHGYNTFPIGCRSLLLGDKVYISGGKSNIRLFSNVLIYDIKKDKIKRIMDLNIPRAYHSMFYIDLFKTLIVFGGELNKTVEIFDPVLSRWIKIMNLNFSRSNIIFNFDKNVGKLYAIFGIEGKISEYKYSDIIEYLDLYNLKEGWKKLNYYNRTSTNLKCNKNVLRVNENLFLIYGLTVPKEKKKIAVLLNLNKKEIVNIDKNVYEELKFYMNKNKTLTNIITSIDLAN